MYLLLDRVGVNLMCLPSLPGIMYMLVLLTWRVVVADVFKLSVTT